MEMPGETDHLNVPRDLKLPGYVPGSLSQSTIRQFRKITKADRILRCWWIFTGLTHVILESYFAFSPRFYQEKTPHLLAEVWKEYGEGDSQYVARDSNVVALEGITSAVLGPTCLVAVYAIATKKSYSNTSNSHLSVPALLEGDNFAPSPFYYYAYYVIANIWWAIIPTTIVVHCWRKICTAFQAQGQKKTKAR